MPPNSVISLKLNERPAFARLLTDRSNSVLVSTYQLDSDSSTRAGEYPQSSIPVSSNMLLDVSIKSTSIAATTDNKGFAFLVDTNTGTVVSSWLAHSLPYLQGEGCEVWTCCMTDDASLVATGGEDTTMKIWDTRTKTSISHAKVFDAGVTFIDWLDDNVLLTGCYDEYMRLIDRRSTKIELRKVKLPGGVWNIEKTEDGHYLASCMYGGYALLDGDWQISHANQKPGANLLYGATAIDSNSVVYCTFNDYSVSLDIFGNRE
ncbi:unnamed protein product [Caenorhabditis auriculariae]|uniref:methylated diphthine methylhydrolase n=1 Tax=Caenorhabditis auriculariae TaxID=2777116 RepID=A0A8S1GY02_9PELO|nr:unnamed protein product [Caenorhabditis auriculariae]